jgi:hypothetical protein
MTEKMEWTQPQITIIDIDDTESAGAPFDETAGPFTNQVS